MGFFEWIREGVKRAVLLGFSDAVTHLGTRSADEDISPQLAATLQQSLAAPELNEATPGKLPASPPGRKRLGRSLEQLRESAAKPA